ncbi:MAG: dehydrogenase [Acidobacteria bacterium]|nr:MAG: dehydrogenase [Acidobacteriota bacterium]
MSSLGRRKLLWLTLLAGFIALLIWAMFKKGREITTPTVSGLKAIRVPGGFAVEKVAGENLVAYPMLGTLDERGRLFLCESSGKNVTTEEMKANPEFRIRLLEDLNGDGIYDRSQVFADKLTMPAGAVWYGKSLYVASPPDLIRFDDTNNDGIADRREVVLTGWNLSSNAASLHGPFLGPDGWLYLTDGRHGYKIQTKEGSVVEGKASRIWRCRPDGSRLEWMSGGGFDNPVELIFTAAGEAIGTMTYFTDPQNGQRDALLHFVEGGVYPKWHPTVSEFKRTGDLMPVMTKFARISPAGLLRYRSTSFGPEYQGNLFSAQFNPHRVQRHIVVREGATFRTQDEDFLTSSDPDFHPTDVMEDADGSLLVVDTGAWFIHGCPISRISKPQIRGAIYRVRKISAPKIEDPRGEKLKLEHLPVAELSRYVADSRTAVRDRSLQLLVETGENSVGTLKEIRQKAASPEIRCEAVFALSRIGSAAAQQAIRQALDDPDFLVRVAAARAVGLGRDRQAVDRLLQMVQKEEPAVRRQAATALGQIGDVRATSALVSAAANPEDRFVEHSIFYALIQLKDSSQLIRALRQPDPLVQKAALIVLDQTDGSQLKREQAAPLLNSKDRGLRQAALWVISHHPNWAGAVLDFLNAHLRTAELPVDEANSVREVLLAFCGDTQVQKMLAGVLGNPDVKAERQLFLLDTIDRCSLKELPQAWVQPLARQLTHPDASVRLRTIGLIRSRGIQSLDETLRRMASNNSESADLRTAALGVRVDHHAKLEDSDFQFLLAQLQAGTEATLRLSAAQVLGKADLTNDQLLLLADRFLPQADALILSALLDAFHSAKDEQVGQALVNALRNPKTNLNVIGSKRIEPLFQAFSETVQLAAKPLQERFRIEQAARLDRLAQLQHLLTAGGDIGRGRSIFFGKKVACSSCHTIGREGGHVGPDLTSIGSIRSGHDLLEAIVFPSASFVPGHEVYRVKTKKSSEILSGVIGEQDSDAITLISGPNAELRLPRDQIASMEPSTVSLMPEGLDTSLTQQEFTDLLAFLQAER